MSGCGADAGAVVVTELLCTCNSGCNCSHGNQTNVPFISSYNATPVDMLSNLVAVNGTSDLPTANSSHPSSAIVQLLTASFEKYQHNRNEHARLSAQHCEEPEQEVNDATVDVGCKLAKLFVEERPKLEDTPCQPDDDICRCKVPIDQPPWPKVDLSRWPTTPGHHDFLASVTGKAKFLAKLEEQLNKKGSTKIRHNKFVEIRNSTLLCNDGEVTAFWDEHATDAKKFPHPSNPARHFMAECRVPHKLAQFEHVVRLSACKASTYPVCLNVKLTQGPQSSVTADEPLVQGWSAISMSPRSGCFGALSRMKKKRSCELLQHCYANSDRRGGPPYCPKDCGIRRKPGLFCKISASMNAFATMDVMAREAIMNLRFDAVSMMLTGTDTGVKHFFGCRDTPHWRHSSRKWAGCHVFEAKGWCKDGSIIKSNMKSVQKRWALDGTAEKNCCACGKTEKVHYDSLEQFRDIVRRSEIEGREGKLS